MSARYTFAAFNTTVGSPSKKLILLKLADNANDDGISWPGMSYICEHCELSRSTVVRNLKELEEGGYISVKRRKTDDGKRNKSNAYKLHLSQKIDDDGSISDVIGWCHHDTRVVSPRHQGGVTMTPESTNEPTNEPKQDSQSSGSTPRPGEFKETVVQLEDIYQRSILEEPEQKTITRLDTRQNAVALATLWNQIIDEHNPNWRKVSTPEVLSAKRERTAKTAIQFFTRRYKLKHNGACPTVDDCLEWFEDYLTRAAHHHFHGGHQRDAKYPEGFRRDFNLQLRQDQMENFIDENNEG